MSELASTFFTRAEMERSPTATRRGIDNTMPDDARARMQLLVTHLLDPLRRALGRPVRITSGYRCAELNKRIGGSSTSQHKLGEAVDFEVPAVYDRDGRILKRAMTTSEIVAYVRASGLPFDQLIDEAPPDGWVHVSYRKGRLRRQVLRAVFVKGKAQYSVVP